jgi:cell division protein FtsQ
MHQQIGKKIFIYLFILLFLGTFNNQKLLGLNQFALKNIIIETSDNTNFVELSDEILNQKKLNIFFINLNNIKNIIEKNNLVEKYYVIKNYPSTLKIKIVKTKFFSRLNIDGKTFNIGTNGKLIEEFSNNNNLPFIFGNPSIDDVIEFYTIIKTSKFNFNNFTNLFYYKSGRWDIETIDGIIIKLPNDNLEKKLQEIHTIISNKDFTNQKIIDARIINQLILYD